MTSCVGEGPQYDATIVRMSTENTVSVQRLPRRPRVEPLGKSRPLRRPAGSRDQQQRVALNLREPTEETDSRKRPETRTAIGK